MMSGIYFGFLFGVNFMLLVCEGKISLTTEKTKLTFKPGSSENITWTIDVGSAVVATRTWSFTSSGEGSTRQTLGVVSFDGAPQFPPGNPLPRFKIIKPSLLALYNVDQSYDGTYLFSLKVDGVEDEIPSNIRVFIARKPTVTTNCSRFETRDEGDDLICLCRTVGGNPPANVTWYDKTGKMITDIENENQTLKLMNLSVADSGTYKCIAESYPDEKYRDEVSVSLTVRPKSAKPEKTTVTFSPKKPKIGDTVKITCNSVGVPEPRRTITHNDTIPIITDSTKKTYILKNVQWKNAGKYACTATNGLGSDTNSSILYLAASTPRKVDCENSGTVTAWHVVVALVSGIIIGIFLNKIVLCWCRKYKSTKSGSNPEPHPAEADTTYQELDLSKMNKEENYQSLRETVTSNDRGNGDSTYTELNKVRDVENNYQSLT